MDGTVQERRCNVCELGISTVDTVACGNDDCPLREGSQRGPVDPTSRGDAIAEKVRIWYEANRERWWDRHRPSFFGYRDNSGVVADEFMLRLVQAVAEAERTTPKFTTR